ncbi:hypothetical protein J6590_011786 [Homalodisca vitripennis]|nr:hypothetical protein J6590_011786 [Homalodisca vitripennis]
MVTCHVLEKKQSVIGIISFIGHRRVNLAFLTTAVELEDAAHWQNQLKLHQLRSRDSLIGIASPYTVRAVCDCRYDPRAWVSLALPSLFLFPARERSLSQGVWYLEDPDCCEVLAVSPTTYPPVDTVSTPWSHPEDGTRAEPCIVCERSPFDKSHHVSLHIFSC